MKSLPQEWLWCETWCSDESKKNAKTIDLVSLRLIAISVYLFNFQSYVDFDDVYWKPNSLSRCFTSSLIIMTLSLYLTSCLYLSLKTLHDILFL